MAGELVAIADVSDELGKILDEVGDEALDVIRESVEQVSKEAVKKLKADSPRATGEYAKGWAKKVEKGRLGITATLYNKKKPQLTHLLEKGHAKRGGGRTKAMPHIKPAEQWANREVVERIKEGLEK